MAIRSVLAAIPVTLLLFACGHNPTRTASAPVYDAGLGGDFESIGPATGSFNLPRRIRHKPTGIVLILVDPGTFTMGTPVTEKYRDLDEEQHQVTLSTPFYLGETEVTVYQWQTVMGGDANDGPDPNLGELPMTGVSWHQAKSFVARLNRSGNPGWRLPDEAEWEYACRAGTTTTFSFGEDVTPRQVNYNDKHPYLRKTRGLDRDAPVPVRSLPANPWGFYEMHGNVWEWCEDVYLYHPHRDALPASTVGVSRVIRGGGFPSRGRQVRSGYRDGYPPGSTGEKYGLRLARSVALK